MKLQLLIATVLLDKKRDESTERTAMKYVLVKLTEEGAQKFVTKAGSKVLGVWDVPSPCDCPKLVQQRADSWEFNQHTGRMECIDCGGTHKTVTTLAERLRMAFQGRNIVKKYRR